MTAYSPFYMFLSYLQIGTIILTFILAVIGLIAGILAIKALLIYIKKNNAKSSMPVSAAEMTVEQQAVLPEPKQAEEVEIVSETVEEAAESNDPAEE